MGSLTGSVTTPVTATALNLTNEGTSDWKHWGRGGVLANIDHKSTGGSQISDGGFVGSPTITSAFNNNAQGETWSDGTPTGSITENPGSGSGVYTPNLNNGYSFTAPADTTSRTLKVYTNIYGGNSSSGASLATFTAHLSDSSAADYTNSSFMSATQTVSTLAQFTLVYTANSPSQTLTITVKLTTDNSSGGAAGANTTMNSATLALTAQSVGEMEATMQRTNTPMFQPIGIVAY